MMKMSKQMQQVTKPVKSSQARNRSPSRMPYWLVKDTVDRAWHQEWQATLASPSQEKKGTCPK